MVDTNVLLDLFASEEDAAWSRSALAHHRRDRLAINAIVRAEFAPRFEQLEEQSAFLDDWGIETIVLTNDSAFRAGQAHREYRRVGGSRQSILADFLIGGHASVLGAALMTRDRGRFAAYFPQLVLITPENFS